MNGFTAFIVALFSPILFMICLIKLIKAVSCHVILDHYILFSWFTSTGPRFRPRHTSRSHILLLRSKFFAQRTHPGTQSARAFITNPKHSLYVNKRLSFGISLSPRDTVQEHSVGFNQYFWCAELAVFFRWASCRKTVLFELLEYFCI